MDLPAGLGLARLDATAGLLEYLKDGMTSENVDCAILMLIVMKPGSGTTGLMDLMGYSFSPYGLDAQYWCIAQQQFRGVGRFRPIVLSNQCNRFDLCSRYDFAA
jgi:hypothetical protein